MQRAERFGITVRVAAATGWAGVLILGGLWGVLVAPRQIPMFGPVALAGGMAFIGAGQFVFMAAVADRLFPRASHRVVWTMELASFLVFAVGFALAAWFFVGPGRR